ncbi:MAG: GAF and HD-GYP domain-containing protein [Spirochaetaceae bacterium]
MAPTRYSARHLLDTIKRIHKISDLHLLLETVLHEARLFVRADAGTLYLRQNDRLYFNYIENDTLFPEGRAPDKHVYSENSIPVDKGSLAGYCAATGEPLLIDDVYDIRSDVSYSFNPSYDRKTSYKTQSILVVPLERSDRETVGVLQLINKKGDNGRVVPFSTDDRVFISYFAQHAAEATEKADLARQMIMRMVEMAEIRDPHESMQHARRVGDYSLELYDAWARRHGVPLNQRMLKKDMFRTAAVLHDVGKAALTDRILQKKGELNHEERIEMYKHTVYGARLFRNKESGWDRIAFEVALNHHERWDGSGYPGYINDIYAPVREFGRGKRGREIPLSARIVAVADVYDALISEREYKEAWDQKAAQMYIRKNAGRLFDPEIVECFLELGDVLDAIKGKHAA